MKFLHSDQKEEIYMEQSKGFVASGQEHLVCRLKKSLYGLKQALQQWYKKFDEFIQSVGFSKSDADHCLFTKIARDGSPIFLIIYVDDKCFVSNQLYWMCPRTLQHAIGEICLDPTPH